MKYVKIYKLKNDGSQETIVICRLINNEVQCEGDDLFIADLKNKGILDYSQPQRQALFFKDGLHFLEQLKYNFKSGYLNASEIEEK